MFHGNRITFPLSGSEIDTIHVLCQAESFILLTNSANSSSMISSSSLPSSDPRWRAFCDVFMASFFTASTMFCIFEIGWLIGDIFSFLTLIRWCCDVFVFRVLNVSRGEQLDQVGQNFLYHFLGLSSSLAWSFIFISSYFQFTKALGKVGIRR